MKWTPNDRGEIRYWIHRAKAELQDQKSSRSNWDRLNRIGRAFFCLEKAKEVVKEVEKR